MQSWSLWRPESLFMPFELKVPTAATLKKYGLDVESWRRIADAQNNVCFVCQKVPPSGRLHIDHNHVRGWKAMPPHERRKFVRGLLCSHDNRRHLQRGMTVEKAQRIIKYLERYDKFRGENG